MKPIFQMKQVLKSLSSSCDANIISKSRTCIACKGDTFIYFLINMSSVSAVDLIR